LKYRQFHSYFLHFCSRYSSQNKIALEKETQYQMQCVSNSYQLLEFPLNSLQSSSKMCHYLYHSCSWKHHWTGLKSAYAMYLNYLNASSFDSTLDELHCLLTGITFVHMQWICTYASKLPFMPTSITWSDDYDPKLESLKYIKKKYNNTHKSQLYVSKEVHCLKLKSSKKDLFAILWKCIVPSSKEVILV